VCLPCDEMPTYDMKRKILITERKIKDRGDTWKIKTSDELNNPISNKNIINYIKAQ
jgi:hypothetical protein